ncbi:MAG: hypothetical protein QXG39_00355 [Candidatus Aenigmatarchaeota archaeon]
MEFKFFYVHYGNVQEIWYWYLLNPLRSIDVNQLSEMKKRAELMYDSGGLQFQLKSSSGQNLDRFKIFKIQNDWADWIIMLDQPQYDGIWEEGIKMSRKNVEDLLENFPTTKDRLLITLHGDTIERTKKWWEEFKTFGIKRFAIANKSAENTSVSSHSYLFWTIWLLLNEEKLEMLHLLGFSAVKLFPAYFYVIRRLEEVGVEVKCLSSDSKTARTSAYNLRYHKNDRVFSLKKDRKRGFVWIPRLLCECEWCKKIEEVGLQNFIENPNYSWLANHNLNEIYFTILQYKFMCEYDLKKYGVWLKNNYYGSSKTHQMISKVLTWVDEYVEGKLTKKGLLDKLFKGRTLCLWNI